VPVAPPDPSHHARPRRTRATLVTLVIAALALSLGACGSDDAEGDAGGDAASTDTTTAALAVGELDDVVVGGEPDAKPTLTYDWPLSVGSTTARVITDGAGVTVTEGMSVVFDHVAVNARDGKEFDTTFGAQPLTVVMDIEQTLPGMVKGLLGAKVGSRVLMAIAPADGFQPTGGIPESGIEADDTLLILADVRSVRTPLSRAEGAAVAPRDGLPRVTLADDGTPTIAAPSGTAPTELIVQPLIEGTGAAVGAGQTVLAHYTGLIWATGEEFDSSWGRGEPASFSLAPGGVIDAWSQGLVGVTIGSQVIMVVPPALGYGAEGNADAGISRTDTLLFVIDILDAY